MTGSNEELTKKLEDKNAKIKSLSAELTSHEANFKEIKTELNEVNFSNYFDEKSFKDIVM